MTFLRRALVVLVLAAAALVTAAAPPAWACSCAEIDPLESAELAFTGVATSVHKPWTSDLVTIRFAVESVQKGKAGDEVELTTHSEGPTCGYPFIEGRRYRVYTNGTDTTSCDGNEDLGFAGVPPSPSENPVARWTATATGAVGAVALAVVLYRRRRS